MDVRRGLLVALVAGLACQMDNPAFDRDDGADEGGVDSKAEDTTFGDGDGEAETDPGDGDGETDTGPGETEAGDGDGETDTEAGDGDGDEGIECWLPFEDPLCQDCVNELCCELVATCEATPKCNCMADCVWLTQEPLLECLTQCEVAVRGPVGLLFGEVSECLFNVNSGCGQSCG